MDILGIGGLGKTTLAAQCTRELAVNANGRPFDLILWRSLVNAPPLTELLPPLLQILANQQLNTMPESVDEQLRLLLGYLRDKRRSCWCWITWKAFSRRHRPVPFSPAMNPTVT